MFQRHSGRSSPFVGGDATRGRALLQKVIAKDPKQPRAYVDLAFSQHRAGDDSGGDGDDDRRPEERARQSRLSSMRPRACRSRPDESAMRSRRCAGSSRLPPTICTRSTISPRSWRIMAERRPSFAEAVTVAEPLARRGSGDLQRYARLGLFSRRRSRQGASDPAPCQSGRRPDQPVFGYHLGAVMITSRRSRGRAEADRKRAGASRIARTSGSMRRAPCSTGADL